MEYLIGNFFLCLLYAIVVYGLLPISTKKKNIIYGIITFIQLTIVHGLVDIDVMADLPGYSEIYANIYKNGLFADTSKILSQSEVEIGYRIFMWMVSSFTKNFNVFLLVNSLLMLFFYYKTFFRYSPLIWLSVLLLLLISYNQSIFVLRQHLSISLLLMSYPYIINRQFGKFLLVFILSYLLHKSSLIFFPIFFLYNIKSRKLFVSIFIVGIFVLSFASYFLEKYWMFFIREESFTLDDDKLGISTKGLIMFVMLVLYIFSLKKHVWDEGINKLVLTISTVGVIGNFFLGTVGHGRALLSFYIIMIIQLTICVKYQKVLLYKIITVLAALVLFFAWAFFFAADVSYWLFFRLII